MNLVDKSKFDFNEDPVNFQVPLLHFSETVCSLNSIQKQELLSQGATIKQGKFTPEEDAAIFRNLKKFCKRYKIDDRYNLLGVGRYAKDKDMLKFIKAKHFYVRLGKHLTDRTLQSIYKRARLLLYDPKNSEESNSSNTLSVKWMHKMYGNKWQKMGDTVGKSADSCLQKFRWNEKTSKKGKWTEEEEKNLMMAIKKVTKGFDESALTNIPWGKVAVYVPTRNASQCRWHWAYNLAGKPNASGIRWNKRHYIELIQVLKRDWDVIDSGEIDWEIVYESFQDVIPSQTYLQKKWLYLKYKVPNYQNMNQKDLIKNLCMMYGIEL